MNKDKEAKPHGFEIATHEDKDSVAPGNESAAVSNMANDEEVQTVPHQQDTVVEQYTQLKKKQIKNVSMWQVMMSIQSLKCWIIKNMTKRHG